MVTDKLSTMEDMIWVKNGTAEGTTLFSTIHPKKPEKQPQFLKKYVCGIPNSYNDSDDTDLTADCIVAVHIIKGKPGKIKPMIVKFLYH